MAALGRKIEMKSITIVLVCAMSGTALAAKEKPPTTYTIPLPPRPDFTLLEWMVGEWMGKTEGRGPKGEVRLAVTFSLEKCAWASDALNA